MNRREGSLVAARYRRMLAGVHAVTSGESALESFEVEGPSAEVDLSGAAIDARVDAARKELHRIVKAYLEDKPELYRIADEIAQRGKPALETVRDGNVDAFADADILAGLEVIVRSDGSRPSFMVRNGEADRIHDSGRHLGPDADRQRAVVARRHRVHRPHRRPERRAGISAAPASWCSKIS